MYIVALASVAQLVGCRPMYQKVDSWLGYMPGCVRGNRCMFCSPMDVSSPPFLFSKKELKILFKKKFIVNQDIKKQDLSTTMGETEIQLLEIELHESCCTNA